jgi:hypothetical protein
MMLTVVTQNRRLLRRSATVPTLEFLHGQGQGSGAEGKKARFCCAFRRITDLDLLRILIPEQRC